MQPNDWRRVTRSLTEAEVEQQERERMALAIQVNSTDTSGPELDAKCVRVKLEAEHGQVWNSFELAGDFEVEAFSAPLVIVKRRRDGVRGTMVFQHCPRFYWGFDPA